MPTSARKSSVGGARRGPQKAHIPYRGDNAHIGRKTGIEVPDVERNSDGFEPFDRILEHADKKTPPKVKPRKRKSVVATEDEFDEDGEVSMDVDSKSIRSSLLDLDPTFIDST